jgi:hypothetical protein
MGGSNRSGIAGEPVWTGFFPPVGRGCAVNEALKIFAILQLIVFIVHRYVF